MPYRGLALHHARGYAEGMAGGVVVGRVDDCGTTGGGGGFRVTAEPLLFIYSVSRLFVQTYSERPRAITARRATPLLPPK